MEAVFIDVGSNRRDLGDLVSQRLGVFSLKRGATAFAVRRLDLEGLAQLLGRDECLRVTLVTGLAAAFPP